MNLNIQRMNFNYLFKFVNHPQLDIKVRNQTIYRGKKGVEIQTAAVILADSSPPGEELYNEDS